jgi:hypothetical protein
VQLAISTSCSRKARSRINTPTDQHSQSAMCPSGLLILLVVCVGHVAAFHSSLRLRTTSISRVSSRPVPVAREKRSSQLQAGLDFSQLVAVGDYASEIEKGVGSEIYGPIFKAGLFIFASGLSVCLSDCVCVCLSVSLSACLTESTAPK